MRIIVADSFSPTQATVVQEISLRKMHKQAACMIRHIPGLDLWMCDMIETAWIATLSGFRVVRVRTKSKVWHLYHRI